MATTTVSDAIVIPQAKGTGLSSEDDVIDAAGAALLSRYDTGEYVDSGYANGMQFTNHDGANDTVDVDTGACFILDDSSSTSGSRGSGGNPQVQSTTSSGYDTEVPGDTVYLVIFPTTVTISVSSATLNQIWVNITDVTSNNAVEVRSDGGGGTTTAPSDTFVKLGSANPDDASQDTRANDDADPTFNSVTTDALDIGTADLIDSGDNLGFVSFGGEKKTVSESTNDYKPTTPQFRIRWDKFAPSNATVEWFLGGFGDNGGDQLDVRLQNVDDGETLIEGINVGANGGGDVALSGTYSPTTTSSLIAVRMEMRNSDNSTTVSINDPTVIAAIQT